MVSGKMYNWGKMASSQFLSVVGHNIQFEV
uniref:Uncharacterized protein n=1 Tax=Lepeophtheirus salmonis TaxID=72036 RepID=A0A0K2TWA7_LEPSM